MKKILESLGFIMVLKLDGFVYLKDNIQANCSEDKNDYSLKLFNLSKSNPCNQVVFDGYVRSTYHFIELLKMIKYEGYSKEEWEKGK